MKKITLLLVLMYTTLSGTSQLGQGTPETYKQWKNKTLVVLNYPGFDVYNEAVKNIIQKKWTDGNVEYVDYTNLKSLGKRNDIVVICVKQWYDYDVPVIGMTTKMNGKFSDTFMQNGDSWVYNYVQSEHKTNWIDWKKNKWNKKSIKNYTVAKGLTILNNSSLERIEVIVSTLLNTVESFKDKEFQFLSIKKHKGIYNTPENISLIKSKTLLIEKKNLPRSKKHQALLKLEHIESLYKGNIKVVSEQELKTALKEKDPNMLYFHVKENTSSPVCFIIDIESGKILFTTYEQTKPGDRGFAKIFERLLIQLSTAIN